MFAQVHTKYVKRCFSMLPHQYISQDLNHLSLVNFTISSLDLLESLSEGEERAKQIDWIYLHLLPNKRGFRGSLNASLPVSAAGSRYDAVHLPATYFAISTLLVLGDDLSRIDTDAIMQELSDLQQDDGSFSSSTLSKDIDLRFSYMAVALRFIIFRLLRRNIEAQDFDLGTAARYIRQCRNFDGGFGQVPSTESHAGLTFCALAAQHLLGEIADRETTSDTLAWLVARHNSEDGGFNGRVGKESDVCYCFWNVSSLAIIGHVDLIDQKTLCHYLATCETRIGGYGKTIGDFPDIYHSYLGLATQKILQDPDPLLCALSISRRAIGQYHKDIAGHVSPCTTED